MYSFFFYAFFFYAVLAFSESDFTIISDIGDGSSAQAFLAKPIVLGPDVVLKVSKDNTTDYLLEHELEIMNVGVNRLYKIENG
jgi:serine/threonine protein kinase